MRLSREDFLAVVERTPLVSIDLIVRDAAGRVLLGKRTNEPAKGFWFVPGGRICKSETIERAFWRISLDELGKALPLGSARFLGVFEHFYPTNFAESAGAGTHYVVLAYELADVELPERLPRDQHGEFEWFDEAELLSNAAVHAHTKAYFGRKRP